MCSHDVGVFGLVGFEAKGECLEPASGPLQLLTLVSLHNGLHLVIRDSTESSVFAQTAVSALMALFFLP